LEDDVLSFTLRVVLRSKPSKRTRAQKDLSEKIFSVSL